MVDWDLDIAMDNSYNVIVKGYDPFLIIYSKRGWFAHDPSQPLEEHEVVSMLYHYEDKEEYDKCVELKKVIDEI